MNWFKRRNRLTIDIQTGEVLSGTMDIAVLKRIIARNFPKHHLAHSPGDTRREKKLAKEQSTYKFELAKASERQLQALTDGFRRDRLEYEAKDETLGD